MKRTCSVPVCDEPFYGREWCKAHYQRWLTKGDPGTSPVSKKRPGRICSVDGCENPQQSRGFCKPHYRRWTIRQDPGPVEFIVHPVPREALTYSATHLRLAAERGSAKAQTCIYCGVQASDWAYQHNDPDPLMSDRGMLYSDDIIGCYEPMCRSCHRALDRTASRSPANR